MPVRGGGGSDTESDSAHTEFVGTFETLRDEGEHFAHVAQYKRAIDSFSKALEFKVHDKQCLVARSQCYLQLGDAQNALADAEATLDQDSTFIRAIYQKAQSLYQIGDFETALVFYHRGNKLRPELDEFRLGIQKSQEAITNSIGAPESIKLKSENIDLTDFHRDQEKGKKAPAKGGYQKPVVKQEKAKQMRIKKSTVSNEKTVQQLLGELYGDKTFLESLLYDDAVTGQNSQTSHEVKHLVIDCLEYLDTRTDFWRQQKPLYARKRDRALRLYGPGAGKKQDPTKYILRQLEAIDDAQADGRYRDSLKQAKNTMKTVEGWSESDITNKHEILANLHSLIGNAYLEMNDSGNALVHHEKDMAIAEKYDLADALSRALDNLGRVYARKGNYEKAVEMWTQKLPMEKTPMESTWLYHEIGRCYLELNQYAFAKDYGEKSLSSAKEADDLDWQLHAMVLLAQSEVKLMEFRSAIDYFERALEIAETSNDDRAVEAIQNAISETNKKIVKEIKSEEQTTLADVVESEVEEQKDIKAKSPDKPEKTERPVSQASNHSHSSHSSKHSSKSSSSSSSSHKGSESSKSSKSTKKSKKAEKKTENP